MRVVALGGVVAVAFLNRRARHHPTAEAACETCTNYCKDSSHTDCDNAKGAGSGCRAGKCPDGSGSYCWCPDGCQGAWADSSCPEVLKK
eukprot:CAMPEP_0204274874 /NCGR_PEP_ID=MMETSP0468-20130131/25433_1 /ASSEMBLY_ACC=CAM_ASM_000383 /TAXON_ID=2969 /ORGANISM="Oxyrrhis marina" /LENGTH=88 /DNA_ID=CAMNT_0051251135 /DNA_START=59 /DNA_END=325 /DNA_ORIENTATION=+